MMTGRHLRGPMWHRFWRQVIWRDGTSCWEWTGALTGAGYGLLSQDGGRGARLVYAHRAAWEMARGQIPPGMCICHTCDNRSCVRLDHLFLGTRADNNHDMIRKGRAAWQVAAA
jgi:hypothetical protein